MGFRRFVVRFCLSFLGFGAVVAAAAGVLLIGSWYLAIAATVVLSLGLVVAGMIWRQGSLCWAALVALPAGILCAMELGDYVELRRGEVVRLANPSQASAHPDAAAFLFDQALVRADLQATYRHESRTRASQPATITYYHLAPVVTGEWDQAQPIHAWAVCTREPCKQDWEKPFRAAIRAPRRKNEEYGVAAGRAESEHSVSSEPAAAFLIWVASPEPAIGEYRRSFWLAVQFWAGFLVAGWVIYGGYRLFRKR